MNAQNLSFENNNTCHYWAYFHCHNEYHLLTTELIYVLSLSEAIIGQLD